MARTLPNLGLKAFYNPGESGWGDDISLNMLKLSVLSQGRVISKVSSTPGSPSQNDTYIFDQTHSTQPNQIAVYDNGAWVYITPQAGWMLYNIAMGYYEQFTTVWSQYIATPEFGPQWTPLTFTSGSAYGTTYSNSTATFTLATDKTLEVEAYVYRSGTTAAVFVGDLTNGYSISMQTDDNIVAYRWSGITSTSLGATGTGSQTNYAGKHKMSLSVTRTSSDNRVWATSCGIHMPASTTVAAFTNNTFTLGACSISLATSDITKCVARARLLP